MSELVLVTGPSQEPVTLAEVKLHLRVDISDDDTLISSLITAAREQYERINQRSLLTTTWRLVLDSWPSDEHIILPRPPLQSVTSIQYVDSSDNTNTWPTTEYVVETERTPGRITLAYGKTWPTATLRPASPISVTFVAGWTDVADVPQVAKQAILLLVGHWYENRETVMVTGAIPKELPLAFMHLAMTDRVYASW